MGMLGFGILSAANSFAIPGFKKKPWCEGWLRKEPGEISAFRLALENDPDYTKVAQDWKWEEFKGNAPKVYPQSVVPYIEKMIDHPRFSVLGLEMRSRLISFLLVEWIRIPHPRDNLVVMVSNFVLRQVLNHEFNPTELARIRLSFKIFLDRRSTFKTRSGGTIGIILNSAFKTMPDALMSAIFAQPLLHLAQAYVPGISFVPVPLFWSLSLIRNIHQSNFIKDLAKETIEIATTTDAAIVQKMALKTSIADLDKNWRESMNVMFDESHAIKIEGSLLALVKTFSELFLSKPDERKMIFNLMIKWAGDLAAVNPLDSREVIQCFKVFKSTAETLGLSEEQYNQISEKLRAASTNWVGNEALRAEIKLFLSSSYGLKKLPE